MSYNAWMPLQNQGTDGKTYQYSAKKNERTSRGGTNTATDRKKNRTACGIFPGKVMCLPMRQSSTG